MVEVTVADIETDEPVYSSLTAREQVFVDAVVMGSSYTDAARLAGYGPDRPDISGSKLMRKPAVRMAVQERRTQAAHAAGIDTHRILVRMADIAFGRSVVDSDVVMMRALETLLTYTTKGGGSVEERTTLARSITDRFNRAKLRPAKPVLKLITGSQK